MCPSESLTTAAFLSMLVECATETARMNPRTMTLEELMRKRAIRRAASERYRSTEHGKVAVRVREHNRRGASGTHSAEDIALLIKSATVRGVLRCWHCGKPCGNAYEIDHFIPLAKGGTNDVGNLRISCVPCNRKKGAKLPSEFNGRLL